MKDERQSEAWLVRYLLGDLSEGEQIEIEERAFEDRQFLRTIQAVESDLIDEYVRGGLSVRERQQFESRFFASVERRRKVAFGTALARVIPEFAITHDRVRQAVPPAVVSRRATLVAFFRGLGGVPRFALAAVAVLMILGGSWLVLETMRLRAHLRAEQQARQQQEEVLQRQLADERDRGDDLAAQLQREQQQRERTEQLVSELEQVREAPAQSQPSVVSLVLLSGFIRDSAAHPKLRLNQSTRLVRLQIEIEPADEYGSFNLELIDEKGQKVWTRDGLASRTKRGARSVVVNLPASILSPGKYEFTLKGVTTAQTVENVGFYYFDVTRK